MHLSDSEKRLFNVAERIAVIGSKIESLKSEVPLGDYGGPDFESTTYQWEEWNGVAMKYRAKNLGGALGLSTLHVVLYDTEHCVTGAVWSD